MIDDLLVFDIKNKKMLVIKQKFLKSSLNFSYIK